MVLDGLDGRVARLTHTQSAFGAEYDSLSDMVSFGVAPALVTYAWALRDMGRLGWIAAFIYCVGAALRLARFNSSAEASDKRFFQGLPSPAAAALMAGFVWVMIDLDVAGAEVRWLACTLLIFAGITMVSSVRFYSFKDFNLRRSVPFLAIVAIALSLALFSYEPSLALFGLFVVYALSGHVLALVRLVCRRTSASPD
jgi:CDP-diacylglycerol--serine O-phosphatidyltransferase